MFARRLTKYGFLNAQNEDGNTLLHYAAEENNASLLREIVLAGADVDVTNELLETPLIKAVEYENHEAALYLLDHGASVHTRDHEGYSAIHWATIGHDMKMVKLLLIRGASLFSETDNGETPLHHAAQYGNAKLVRFYIKRGADVNQESQCGTPLFQAITQGRLFIVDILLANGADMDLMDPDGGKVEDALQSLEERIATVDDDGFDWQSDDEDDHFQEPGLYDTMRLKLVNVQYTRSKAKENDVQYFIDLFNKGIVPLKAQVYPLLSDAAKDQLMQWMTTVRGDMRNLFALYHGSHDLVDPPGPISLLLSQYLILPEATRAFLFAS